ILLLVLCVQVREEDQIGADHEIVDHSHAAALAAAGPAPPSLTKPTRAGDQRMAFGLRGDRFLQFLLPRWPQQPGGGPFYSGCFGRRVAQNHYTAMPSGAARAPGA